MSDTTHTESIELSSAVYIAAFLVLFVILAVFADLFVFIIGTLGLIVTFAAFFKDKGHGDEHH